MQVDLMAASPGNIPLSSLDIILWHVDCGLLPPLVLGQCIPLGIQNLGFLFKGRTNYTLDKVNFAIIPSYGFCQHQLCNPLILKPSTLIIVNFGFFRWRNDFEIIISCRITFYVFFFV